MRRSNGLSLILSLAGGVMCLLGSAAGASGTMPAPRAVIEAVRALPQNDATFLDIAIRGTTVPTVTGDGTRFLVTLPDAVPGPQLASHIASGGLVARIALETASVPRKETRIRLELSAPARPESVPGPDKGTLRVRLTATDKETPAADVRAVGTDLYDVDASQADVAGLFKSLARQAGVSIVLAGAVNDKVTIDLHQVTIEQAIDLLSKAAGLAYHRDSGTFVVGTAKDIEAAYPKPQSLPVPPPEPAMRQEVYHCLHVGASEMASALKEIFDKDRLKIGLGAAASSPHLDEATTATVTGIQAATLKYNAAESGLVSRDVILSGEERAVMQALALAQKLDSRRAQVRISVKISDIDLQALKDLGIKWDWSSYSVQEKTPSGIGFGSFTHTPVSIAATLSAMEQDNRSKLLAAPNLTLLDGERGFILIGDRILYPKLIGYTQAQTPIFDKEEERVGIYLQVAVQVDTSGEITLTIYPQVSTVTGYLTVNGASYPQISTREQQTTIRVKDGQQIVIGGLIRNEEIVNIQRVPFLSRIPLFGELFTNRHKTHNHSEVVITITPQILKD